MAKQTDGSLRAYNQSKLANVIFTCELARRLKGSAVTTNAVDPGVVSTSFGADDPGRLQRLFVPFIRPFMKTAAKGAATSVYLASDPELEQVTGRYFVNCKTEDFLPAQLLRGHRGTALAGERRPRRPGHPPSPDERGPS